MSLVKEIMNMKKLNVTLAILVAAVMAGNAATEATSQIVGYSKVTVPNGTRAIVPGFVKAPVFQGSGVVTSQTIVSSGLSANSLGPTAVGTGAVDFPTHYVDIISGNYEGHSYDILSNTASSVTVSGLPSDLAGTTINYVIRPHLTLADIDSSEMPDGSVILNIFNDPVVSATTYIYDSGGMWYDGSSTYVMNHAVIYPGYGVSINSANASSFNITFKGYVKETSTVVPVYKDASINYVGPINPSSTTTLTQWAAPLPANSIANIVLTNGSNGVDLTLVTDTGSVILYDGASNEMSSVAIAGQNAFAVGANTEDGYVKFKSPLQQ